MGGPVVGTVRRMPAATALDTVVWGVTGFAAGAAVDVVTRRPRPGRSAVVVASATAGAWAVAGWRVGTGWSSWVDAAVATSLIALAARDARCHRLPTAWCHRAAALVFALMLCDAARTGRWAGLAASTASATLDWFAFLVVWRVTRRAARFTRFGRGDVRLAWLVGAAASWSGAPRAAVLLGGVALLGGSCAGLVVGVLEACRHRSSLAVPLVPLGPPLAVATLATMFFGPVALGGLGLG